MSAIVGLVIALISASITWELVHRTVANLPSGLAVLVLAILVALAAVVGFLAGTSVSSRARRSGEHLPLFGALAFGVAGGAVGAAYAIAITAAYVRTYADLSGSLVDMILTALAFPILGALGFAVGSAAASVCGLCAAGALRLLTAGNR